jgi:hypothetical protein
MTPKELLIPRYLVIGDFPFNTYYKQGQIISIPTDQYARTEDGEPVFYCDFDKYPDIFQRLQWWQGRTPEEMPKYVKIDNDIRKVYKHFTFIMLDGEYSGEHSIDGVCSFEETNNDHTEHQFCRYDMCEPATESDYITNKKINK